MLAGELRRDEMPSASNCDVCESMALGGVQHTAFPRRRMSVPACLTLRLRPEGGPLRLRVSCSGWCGGRRTSTHTHTVRRCVTWHAVTKASVLPVLQV